MLRAFVIFRDFRPVSTFSIPDAIVNPTETQRHRGGEADSALDTSEWVDALRRAGLAQSPAPRLQPLTGGVSSEIILVEDGARRFVVKRALAKLRVRDDWFADTGRRRVEQSYLRVVGALLPSCVPRVLFADPEAGWFAMEYLGDGFVNWKSQLLSGCAEPLAARRAGEALGVIHRETWGDPAIASEFATGPNFYQLRIEPYLETAARRAPELAGPLLDEAARLQGTALALVHGDFSPKNILLNPDRLVLLDAEVGWYGDPVFDTAFLLNHLLLKALLHVGTPDAMIESARIFWAAYVTALGARADSKFEARTVRLLLCLMLARIHGKSPVEYLPEPPKQRCVVEFVRAHLPRPPARLADLMAAWRDSLRHL
jgi:tRNA A-37 threonylcarbamoyl transferase component Bud32